MEGTFYDNKEYEKGLMIAVIPFTSKILESCSNSIAYQPPNPWTMRVLGLLAENYTMPNLKMNLMFEIEVLFKNLNVGLMEVTLSSLLMNIVTELEGNPDSSNNDIGLTQQPMVEEVKSYMISTLNQVELPVEIGSLFHLGGHARILSQYVVPHHLPVVTLSSRPTYALSEDYAMESDESIIHGVTHLMVASLAGGHLRGLISSQLSNNLQPLSGTIASEVLEYAVQLVTNDNLDLGCAFIEQAAI